MGVKVKPLHYCRGSERLVGIASNSRGVYFGLLSLVRYICKIFIAKLWVLVRIAVKMSANI